MFAAYSSGAGDGDRPPERNQNGQNNAFSSFPQAERVRGRNYEEENRIKEKRKKVSKVFHFKRLSLVLSHGFGFSRKSKKC